MAIRTKEEGAEDPVLGDPGKEAPKSLPTGIRTAVQDMLDRRIEYGMPNGGEIFVDALIADHLPLSTGEWTAIYALPVQPDTSYLARLQAADFAAGGEGGM